MKTIAYNPQHRILSILEDGYVTIGFAGDIAERKLFEALETGANICIVDGSFRMKLKPTNMVDFLKTALEESTMKIIIKRKESNENK